ILCRARGAPRLRRGASERWGVWGAISGPPTTIDERLRQARLRALLSGARGLLAAGERRAGQVAGRAVAQEVPARRGTGAAGILAEIAGMDAVSLQPAAGAQGEFAGVLMIHAYHASRGEKRTKVLIPDSAHGTNPASTAIAGYEVVEVKSLPNGEVDLDALT